MRERPTVVTIGTFDGLHRGHHALFQELKRQAHRRNASSVVLAFRKPPRILLKPKDSAEVLMSWKEKLAQLQGMGFSGIKPLSFNRHLASQSPEEFFRKMFLKNCRARAVVIGERFAFGKNRSGDVSVLQSLGRRHGVDVVVVPILKEKGQEISSSEIRRLLRLGEIERANHLLGYPYFLQGKVVSGTHRGRTLGYPTANLRVSLEKLWPSGVFGVRARVGEKSPWVLGLCNIGTRPTFGHAGPKTMEIHLLKPKVSRLYGRVITVEFLTRLRAERKFPSPEALRTQIERDVEHFKSLTRTAKYGKLSDRASM